MNRPMRPQIRHHNCTPGWLCGQSGRRGATYTWAGSVAAGSPGPQADIAEQVIESDPDPSRGLACGGAGIAAAVRDGPAALPDSAGVCDWPHAAVAVVPHPWRRRCSSAVPGHRKNVARQSLENCFPMRGHASPQGGAGQRQPLRGTLKPACCGDLTKVALPEPRRSNVGVPTPLPAFQVTLQRC